MIDSVIEKPIDKIRYPNVTKKTRRFFTFLNIEVVALFVVLVTADKLMPSDARPHPAILASVFSLLAIINIVAWYRAAKKDARCCHCNSPMPLDSLKWQEWRLIESGLLPVCKKCRPIVGAEFIKPLPSNSVNPVNPVTRTPTERSEND